MRQLIPASGEDDMERTWLYASIYCDRQGSNRLIKELIEPLFMTLKLQDQGLVCLIFLGVNKGEFIGISLYQKKATASSDLLLFDKLVKNYLKSYSPAASRLTGRIFQNFPQNTLHYRLHRFPQNILVTEDAYVLSLSNLLSEIIIEVLSNDIFSSENIMTLGIYLNLLTIKSAYVNFYESQPLLEVLKGKSSIHPSGLNLEENAMLLADIIEDLDDETYIQIAENQWMFRWLKHCSDMIESLSGGARLEMIRLVSVLVGEQLGFGEALRSAIYELFWQQLLKNRDEESADHN